MNKARIALFWATLKPWVLLRLRQPSTYVGLLMKVSAIVGLTMTDSAIGQAAELIAVLVGAALVAYDQTPKPDESDRAGA